MKARYAGRCNLCGDSFPAGATVEKLLSRLVHPGCKSVELDRKASTTTLPSNRSGLERWDSRKQYTTRRSRAGVTPLGWHQS